MDRDYAALNRICQQVLGMLAVEAQPSIVLECGRQEAVILDIIDNEDARHLHIRLRYGDQIEEDLDFCWDAGRNHILCARQARNISGEELSLVEMHFRLCGLQLSGARNKDYFFNAENPRIYGIYAIPVHLDRTNLTAAESEYDPVAGNKWADPGTVTDRIGASVYQPFPATLLSNYEIPHGYVHGSLSQDVFFHNYLIRHENDAITWDIFSSCKAVDSRRWLPGECLGDRWYLGRTEHAADITRMFAEYRDVLRTVLPANYGATDANRYHIVWGSWNDGIFRDIDDERLFAMAEFLKSEYPTVKYMQIDDGYASRADTAGFAHGMGVPFEEDGIDLVKHPNGLRALSDGIRDRGLVPAIWVGGVVPNNTPLGQGHPEWLCDYSYRLQKCKPLDISHPEARAFMEHSMRTFIQHWGFKGIKFDFWSYVFEDSHALLSDNSKTGYEWRRWFLHLVREVLPRESYFQSGCDVCMANPFLGEWFSNYRYGIDIGSGSWEYVKTTMLWGVACFAAQVGDLFVPNSDSIGLLPDLSDEDAQTVINYCLITRSLVEIGGWLYQQPKHPRAAWVKKAICGPNNRQDVFYANFDYRTKNNDIPRIWYLKTAHFAREEELASLPVRTIALFNTDDQANDLPLAPEELGLEPGKYFMTDIWSLETQPFNSDRTFPLPGRSSRLYGISRDDGNLQILDSNIGITNSERTDAGLALTFLFGGALTLVLNKQPGKKISFHGQLLTPTIREGKGNVVVELTLPSAGILRINDSNA